MSCFFSLKCSIPKVSVIIPCYNNQSTILETIESLLSQTYKNIEIIVVNDGSTDSSSDTIQNQNLAVFLINQINQGPSFARNNGAKHATGKYLLFVDGDDLLDKTYIEECVSVLEKNNEINIVYTRANYFEAINKEWKLPEIKFPDFLIDNCIPITAMIKRDMFNDIGGFDENLNFTEDWDLWITIIKTYGGVYKIPKILFFYRKRNTKNSLTDTAFYTDKIERSRLYIYNKHYELYCKHELDITSLVTSIKYKQKYYSIWYKKLFYTYIKPKKH